jgi:hypothetical protein
MPRPDDAELSRRIDNLATDLARILTAPKGDERRAVRLVERFIRDIAREEIRDATRN